MEKRYYTVHIDDIKLYRIPRVIGYTIQEEILDVLFTKVQVNRNEIIRKENELVSDILEMNWVNKIIYVGLRFKIEEIELVINKMNGTQPAKQLLFVVPQINCLEWLINLKKHQLMTRWVTIDQRCIVNDNGEQIGRFPFEILLMVIGSKRWITIEGTVE